MRYRAIEAAGFGKMPRSVWHQRSTYLRRAREKARLRTRHPPHSTRPATGNWLECWLALHRTVDHGPVDFSRHQVVCNSSKTERMGGGHQGGAATGLLMKNCQKVHQNVKFWGHVRSSKRLGRHFCRNRYFFLLSYIISFPAIWGQSWRGQLWPDPVQLGLRILFGAAT
jgi:hypothetical protein